LEGKRKIEAGKARNKRKKASLDQDLPSMFGGGKNV